MKILYLRHQPLKDSPNDLFIKEMYDVRVVVHKKDLAGILQDFEPAVLLCSLEATISPKDVIDVLGNKEVQDFLIISVFEGKLESILSILEETSKNRKEKSVQPSKDERQEFEGRYKSVYENCLEGILVTRPDGTILAANPSACEMLEMSEEEICRLGRTGIVDLEDPRLNDAILQREATGKAHTELNFIKKSGKKFPVELTSAAFKDALGNLKATVILRDISRRKAVEEELRISHDAYRTIFYNSPIPYWIYDQETLQIIDANEVAVENYGYTREEFLELNILDLRPEEEVEHLQKHLDQVLNLEGNVGHGKFIHQKKDGARIKVEVFGYKFLYKRRSCRLVACIDVTEKEEALERLKDKQIRLAATQEIAKIGYWELNVKSKAVYLSDMMYTIWGLDKNTFHPTYSSIVDVVHPADRAEFIKTQNESLLKGTEHHLEYRIIIPNGPVKWIHERGRILRLEDEKPTLVERTIQDITEQKMFLEQLSTSESRYKGIVQSQTNYLIRTDLSGNYTYYNEKFLKDFGWLYDDQEITGQSSLSSIMEYHHEAVIDLVQRCLMAPGTAFKIEIDKPKKKGGIRTTLWDFVCLVNTEGAPVEIQCVGIDISARVKAERQLKDSKLRFELITEATSDVIWDWNITTGKVIWGETFKSMFGYDPIQFTTIDEWDRLIHADDFEAFFEGLAQAIKGTGKKWVGEYRLRRSDGTFADVVQNATIIRNTDFKAVRLVGAIQDISEKKRLQDLLENANKLSRVGSFEMDIKKNTLYWSPMTKEIHEVPPDFKPDLDSAISFYKKGKNRNRLRKIWQKALEQHLPFDEEFQIVTGGGREIWIRAMAQPEVEEGECVRISGSFQDIDKLKAAELKVFRAAQEKETLLESLGDAFFAVNEDWQVTYWNRHAASLLKCTKEEILGKNLWEVFSDAIGSRFERNYRYVMKNKKKRHFQAHFKRTSAWYDVTAYPSYEGLSVFFRDITQKKVADDKLKELNKSLKAQTRELVAANKGLEQFSYIVSHNLRAPVANILGLADLYQEVQYPQDVKAQFLEEIFLNIGRLDMVVGDLNNILQVKINTRTSKEEVVLEELVEGIKASIQHLIEEEAVTIICDFREAPVIDTVKTYLYSIFYNLMLNSIKYKKPHVPAVIKITAKAQEEFLTLTFADNGLGIDLAKKKNEIFNLYKRFHHHIEGKGMGLFMVRTQVEMLGGKIDVESEVDQGTTFTITFSRNYVPLDVKNEKTLYLSSN